MLKRGLKNSFFYLYILIKYLIFAKKKNTIKMELNERTFGDSPAARKNNHTDKLTITEKVKISALERGYTLYDMDKDKKITEVGKCVLKELIEKTKKAGIDTSMIKHRII